MEKSAGRVVITGGTGLIGRALSKELAGAGYEVVVLSRDPGRRQRVAPGVRLERWDARSAAGWGHLAGGAKAVVNFAGENLSSGLWTQARRRRFLLSRAHAGRAVVEAVAASADKPAVVVQASAIGYYGPRDDEVVTEAGTPGTDFLSRLCVQWEASTAPVEEMGVRRVVVRSGLVLDAKEGALPRLLLPFRFFVGGPLGGGRQYYSWIHIADEVAAIRFLIEHPEAQGPYNLTAPNPVTNAEFSRAIGRVMRRPALFPTPGFPIRMVLGEMANVVLTGQRVVPERLRELGYEFRFQDAEAALRDLLG